MYYCYKLMWYIRMVFRGETFPNGRIIPEIWETAISKVVKWVLKKNHIGKLLYLDAAVTMSVLYEIFSEEQPRKLVAEGSIPHQLIINKLAEQGVANAEFMPNFTLFVAKVAAHVPIEKEICLNAAEFLLKPSASHVKMRRRSSSACNVVKFQNEIVSVE